MACSTERSAALARWSVRVLSSNTRLLVGACVVCGGPSDTDGLDAWWCGACARKSGIDHYAHSSDRAHTIIDALWPE